MSEIRMQNTGRMTVKLSGNHSVIKVLNGVSPNAEVYNSTAGVAWTALTAES